MEEEKANKIIEDTKMKVKSILKTRKENEANMAELAEIREKEQKDRQASIKRRHLHSSILNTNSSVNRVATENDDINESPLKSADILAIKSEQANIVRKELSKMLKKNAKLQKRQLKKMQNKVQEIGII